MEHNYAIENHTAERYLLQELDEQERDAYEEHFFSCSACAEEVKIAAEFLDSAKRVVQQELKEQLYGHVVHRSLWGSWLNWRSMVHPMPAMACLLLVVSVGVGTYQNRVTIPGLKQAAAPRLFPALPPLRDTKAAAKEVFFSKGKSFMLPFEIPSSDFSSYDISVVTQSNVKKLSFQNVTPSDAKKALEIFVPAGTLEAGRYSIVIEGSGGKGEVDQIPFELKSQD